MERRRSRDRRRQRISRTSLKSRAPRRAPSAPVVRSRRDVARDAREAGAKPRMARLRGARDTGSRDVRDGGRKAYRSAVPASEENRDRARPGIPILRASKHAERLASARSPARHNDGTHIYIGNLAHDALRTDLQRYFEKTALSGVVQVKMKDQYAVAEFSSHKDAEKALQETNGAVYLDRQLHVSTTVEDLCIDHNEEAGPEMRTEDQCLGRSGDCSLVGDMEEDEEGYDEPDLLDLTPGNQVEEVEDRRRSRSRSRGRARAEEGQNQNADLMLDEKMRHLELLLHERDCEIRQLKASIDRFEKVSRVDPGERDPGQRGERDPGQRGERDPGQRGERDPGQRGERDRQNQRETRERSQHQRERGRARTARSSKAALSPRETRRETRAGDPRETRGGDQRGEMRDRRSPPRGGDQRGEMREKKSPPRGGDQRRETRDRKSPPRGGDQRREARDKRTPPRGGDQRRETRDRRSPPRGETRGGESRVETREKRSAARGEARRSPRKSARPPDERSEQKRKHAERMQEFIVKNSLDDGCSRLLESLTEAQQLAVVNEGFIIDDLRTRGPGKRGNRSAIVVGRINRVTKRERSRR